MGKINLKAEDNNTLSTEKSNKKWLLEELYQTYGKKLHGYVTTSWKLDEDTSWELIYKTLYKVIDTQEQYHFDHENKLAAFIFRVFINHLRNYYRDNKKLSERLHLIRMEDEDVEQIVDKEACITADNKHMIVLKEVLDGLEDWQRMLLLMRSEGRPYAEIAGFINKPEEQLKVYYQRLKATISKTIHERIKP